MSIKVNKRLIEAEPGSFIFEFTDTVNTDNCNDIIKRFEDSKSEHYQGRVGQNFTEQKDIKRSTDMVISGKNNWKDVDELLFTSLSKALSSIKKEFEFFNYLLHFFPKI